MAATNSRLGGAGGCTWVELVIDFEIATRTHLCCVNASPALTSIGKRADTFAAASRHLFRAVGASKLPSGRFGALVPFGANWLAGIPVRLALMNPKAVFLEVANQAITHSRLFQAQASSALWTWPPIYRNLPPRVWSAKASSVIPIPTHRLRGKTSL